MKRLLLLPVLALWALTSLDSQTIQATSPTCLAGTFNFGLDASRSGVNNPSNRNTYVQTDIPSTNLVIAYNDGAGRWEIRADVANGTVYYINTLQSFPDPPSSTAMAWQAFQFCTDVVTVGGTGSQDTEGPDPCAGPGDDDGDGACNGSDICPGFDDFADQDFDGIPDGCDANPTVPDGVLVDASCLDPDPILFTLSGTDGTGRNVYSTSFANGLTVRYNATAGRWEVRASSGTMDVYLFNTYASWPNPPASAGSWQGTSVLGCNTSPTPTINGTGTQNTLGCTISIGTPSVTQPPCGGDGVISVMADDAKGSITYSLKQGSSTISSNGTGTFNALEAGPYTVLASDGAFPDGVCEAETGNVVLVVQDGTAPVIEVCPGVQTLVADVSCQASLPDYTSLLTVSDNCDLSPDIAQSPAAGTPVSNGQVVSFTVSDDSGNANSTCSLTINLNDISPPRASNPETITVSCIGDVPAPDPAVVIDEADNCSTPTVTLESESSEGLIGSADFPLKITRTYRVTDATGNVILVTHIIKVIDDEAPVAICQDITVNLGTSGIYSLHPAELDGGSTDNCDALGFGIETTVFDCDDVGSTFPIQLSVSDNSANFDVCTAQVTVGDANSNCNQAPVATCKDIQVDANANCQATISPADVNNGSFDPNGDALTYSLDNSELIGKGAHTVILTVSDGLLSDACTATVTVNDKTAPVPPAAPDDLRLQCADEVEPAEELVAIDNCDDIIFGSFQQSSTPGNCPNSKTIFRTWTFRDDSGNASSVSQIITVEDSTEPLITCPADVTIECDESTFPANTGLSTAADNCDPSLTPTFSDMVAAGACPQASTITRTWTATDDCGNSSSCVQIITVEDSTEPLITCPADVTIECDESTFPANTGLSTAADNCDPSLTPTFSDMVAAGACTQASTITRTWTVTDDCGNSSSCVQIITVEDSTEPLITCPADVTIECDESTFPANTGLSTAADNCDPSLTPTFSDMVAAGACPQASTITRTWTVTDDCGNSSSCVQIITVEDSTEPLITCPADVTIECDESTFPANTGLSTAADNCDPSLTPTFSDMVAPGACSQASTITRTWTVTDDCGNSSSCVQIITVEDSTTPLLFIPADITVECDESTGTGNTGTASAVDNCDPTTNISYSDGVIDRLGDDCYTIERTWTATDDCGNTTSDVQLIKVEDTTSPLFTFCPGDTEVDCDQSIPAVGSPTAADNCDPSAFITYLGEVRDNSCGSDYYLLTRTWRATDNCGNTTDCVQEIKVNTILSDGCFNITLGLSYNAASKTTTFSWELCTEDRKCQDLSNIRFSLPCDLSKSGVSGRGSSATDVISVFSGKPSRCNKYALTFENFGDGGIQNESGGCATFYYTLAGDYRDYETDVDIKAGRERGLGFDNVGATCDCDGSVPYGGGSLIADGDAYELAEQLLNDPFQAAAASLRAYPNPSSQNMTIEFTVPQTTEAIIDLYDMQGRRVGRIFEQEVEAGVTNTMRIERLQMQLPQGTYIYRLRAGEHTLQGKVVFLD